MKFKTTLGVLSAALFSTSVNAALVTINFESFTAMANNPGALVLPTGSAGPRLSDQLQPTTGAVFSSVGGASYVAVVDLGPGAHAPSEPNAIGGVGTGSGAGGVLDYSVPIMVSFWDPSSPATKAVTDYVSIVGDKIPEAGKILTLTAYGVNGNFLGAVMKADSSDGTPLYIDYLTGIHSITIESDTNTVAFDNLEFEEVTAVPVPAAVWLFGSGLLGLVAVSRRKTQS